MKKLLLSLLLSSSMLHCSSAFAKQTNDDDEGPSIHVAPVPVVHETPAYPNELFVDTFNIFQDGKDYSQVFLKHKGFTLQPFSYVKGLTSATPEDIAIGKTYYTISFPEELDPQAAYKELHKYYIDASVSFNEIEGSDNKLQANLHIYELNKAYKVLLTRFSIQ